MVRSPSSLKVNTSALKRGPWTSDEDQILTEHIKLHGHPNWRALPRLAGLARCGKSCRLRWTNYLQPGIKRGNFTREEEANIINLHQLLGNRWSAIAAKLPGRTDNEIKNVWHTHLKKKLLNKVDENQQQQETDQQLTATKDETSNNNKEDDFILVDESIFNHVSCDHDNSPLHHADDHVNSNIAPPCKNNSNPYVSFSPQIEGSFNNYEAVPSPEDFPETDESFWSDVLSYDDGNSGSSCSIMDSSCYQPVMLVSDVNMEAVDDHSSSNGQYVSQSSFTGSSNNVDGGDVDDFWFDVLFKAGEHPAFLDM